MSDEKQTTTTNLFHLPQEIIEEVLSYLEPEDLLSCSLVSLGMRNAVNSDRVWSQVWKKRIPEGLHDLFFPPYVPQLKKIRRNMNPLCNEWRKFCNWRRIVVKNWQIGKRLECSLFQTKVAVTLCKGVYPDIRNIQTDYDYVFTLSRTRNEVIPSCGFGMGLSVLFVHKMRNLAIRVEGISHRLYVSHAECSGVHDLYKLANGVLVFAIRNLVHVFRRDTGYSRKITFFYDEDEGVRVAENDLKGECPLMIGFVRKARCDHNGKYFVGCYDSSVGVDFQLQPEFHVWDLQSLEKLGKVELPEECKGMDDVEFSVLHNAVGLKVSSGNLTQNRTTVCVYDFDKMCYSSELITRDCVREVIFSNSMIVLLLSEGSARTVAVFDFRGCCLYTVKMRKVGLKGVVPGVDGSSAHNDTIERNIYLSGNILVTVGSRWVLVHDLSRKAQIDKFRISFHGFEAVRIHCMMIVDLIIINTGKTLLVRNFRTHEVVRTLMYTRCVQPSRSCTQILVQNLETGELKVLTFW